MRKKGQRRDVHWTLPEGFPSNVPDLEKSSTLATTSSKHEDDDRDGKQRTSSNDTKRVRETPDPVVARCQMPTSENMYSYPASSFARQVATYTQDEQEQMLVVLTSRSDSTELEQHRQ